jgi:hypothetical protein
MADNTVLNTGTGGDVIATDELTTLNGTASSGVKVQRVKVGHGSENDFKDATPAAPMPVAAYGELVEALEAMRMAVQSLTRTMGQMQPDTAARMRVAIDAITAGLTLATITTVGTVTTVTTVSTVSTVSTLTNQTLMGGHPAVEQIPALMRLGADSMRRNISAN